MGRAAREKRERSLADKQAHFERLTGAAFCRRMRRSILGSGECKNSCIVSTALYKRLCRYYGVTVEPLTVETWIYNNPIAEWVLAHDFAHPPADEMEKLGQRGGRYLVLGGPAVRENTPDEPGNWPGHLIAIVRRPGGGTPRFVDLSIDQAHRPEKGIVIEEPYGGEVSNPGFLTGESALWLRAERHLVVYQAHPKDTSYNDARGWTHPPPVVVDGRELR